MNQLHLLVSSFESSTPKSGEFVFCVSCQAVHRLSILDGAPLYDLDGTAHYADDLKAFLLRHAEHPLAALRRASDVEVHSHARHDPMRRVSWEVSDDHDERYVVSFGREDVESPRSYTIRAGRLVPIAESIAVDSELLRAVVDEVLYPYSAPPTKLAWLMEACQARVAAAAWEAFDPVDEARDDPNTQLACLPDSIATSLAAEAERLFGGIEAERLADLLRFELRFEIPVVRLHRQYVVEAG